MQIHLCAVAPKPNTTALKFGNKTSIHTCEISPLHDDTDPHNNHYPITVECDLSLRVSDFARSLMSLATRHGTDHPSHIYTVAVTDLHGRTWVADPGASLATSGITHGCCVRPMRETEFLLTSLHKRPPVAQLTIRTEQEAPIKVLLREGVSTLGRDPTNRFCIPDASVSLFHASLIWANHCLSVVDHGSSNGTVALQNRTTHVSSEIATSLSLPAQLRLGSVSLEITRVHPPVAALQAVPHEPAALASIPAPSRSDVLTEIHVPELPQPQTPQRFPILTAVAPAAIGAALFLATHSAMSLVGVAVSPIIVFAIWGEQRITLRRARKHAEKQFISALDTAEKQLAAFHDAERSRLSTHSPRAFEQASRANYNFAASGSLQQVTEQPLMLRCGLGSGSSTVKLKVPVLPHPATDFSNRIRTFVSRSRTVSNAPVLLTSEIGPISVVGPAYKARALLRSFLIQAVAKQHAAKLSVYFIVETAAGLNAWSWAAWLPHVPPTVTSAACSRFARDPDEITALLQRIERLHVHSAVYRDPPENQTLVVADAVTPELTAKLLPLMTRSGTRSVMVWAHSETACFLRSPGASSSM